MCELFIRLGFFISYNSKRLVSTVVVMRNVNERLVASVRMALYRAVHKNFLKCRRLSQCVYCCHREFIQVCDADFILVFRRR